MSQKIKDQANKVKETVFSPATAETYSTAIALTWSILKETAQLLWLVICLGLVFGDWFWKKSYATGQNARTWVENLQQAPATPDSTDLPEAGAEEASSTSFLESLTSPEFWSSTGKSLLDASKSATTAALNTAKDQLGLEVPPPAPAEAKPIAPVATPPASVAPSAPPAPPAPPAMDESANS
jgi:hypothetical protein